MALSGAYTTRNLRKKRTCTFVLSIVFRLCDKTI